MPATRSKLRQSRLDFSKAPPTSTPSSPLPTRTTRTQTRSATATTANEPRTRFGTNSSARFLGASTRKKQTYLVHSSDDDSEGSPPMVAPSTNPVDSENLMGTQSGSRAAFVFDETDTEDATDEDDEEEDVPLKTSSARKRKRPTTFIVDDDSDSEVTEDDGSDSVQEVATPLKKSRKLLDRQDEEDLADDLEFLKSSPPAITPKDGALSKKDARSRALEELKRKREKRRPKNRGSQRGRKMVVLDSDDEVSAGNKDIQSGSQSDDDDDFASDDDIEELDSHTILGAHENDDDFIEDDDDGNEGALGVPTSSIPIAFTSWATAKPRELFKFAVEWFVQKKINPAFSRHDEIYELAWQKLNDEITGLVGSKFTSSAWNRDFTFSLQSRPRMDTTRVGTDLLMQDCEACNRTGHPATWRVQFTGNPYDNDTYEDVEQDSEEEEEGITRDRRGHKIPPASREYYMGATCFKNASVAHRLKHWRYSLGEWVISYLADVGELEAEKIVKRDGWKEAKRRNHASAIVQRMEDEGEIQNLYRAMKMEVNSARGAADWD